MLTGLGCLVLLLVAFFSLTSVLQTLLSTPLNIVAGLAKLPQLVQTNAFVGGIATWLVVAWIWSSIFSQAMPLFAFLAGLVGLGASLILGGPSLTHEGKVTLIAEIWGLIGAAIFVVFI